MALTPLDITARVRGLDTADPAATALIRGQVEVATTAGEIVSIALEPPDPEPCPEAIAAVAAADWVVLGPGSWFSSVMPHLMVPELRDALVRTDARVVVVLNLVGETGETDGFGPIDHLGALVEHAPDLRIHTVLADLESVGDDAEELHAAVASYGAELHLADVALHDGSPHHDPVRLAAAYTTIMSGA